MYVRLGKQHTNTAEVCMFDLCSVSHIKSQSMHAQVSQVKGCTKLSMQHLCALMALQNARHSSEHSAHTMESIQLYTEDKNTVQLYTEDKNTVEHNQCCQPWRILITHHVRLCNQVYMQRQLQHRQQHVQTIPRTDRQPASQKVKRQASQSSPEAYCQPSNVGIAGGANLTL